MLSKLRGIFFSVIPARHALAKVRAHHYKPIAPLAPRWPEPLGNLPNEDVAQVNLNSDEYFSHRGQHQYWRNKPLSDLVNGPDCLWRFGLLLSALGIRPEDRVLDFGCGTGWTSIMMARTGADITGMDISPRAVSIARTFAAESLSDDDRHHLRFQAFDGFTIDAPDGYFDFVITMDAFHHLPNPATIVKEFHRVLGPHGCFGFAEPGRGHSQTCTAHDESGHGVLENEVDPEQLRTTARMVGFDELELIVLPVPPGILTLTMPRARWYLRGLPWIVPHDYLRTSILSSPIGILRKGPYIRTSLHPHVLEADIRPSARMIGATPGQPFVVGVSVENTAGTVWLKGGRRGTGYVRLGAHLLNDQGRMLIEDYGRAELPNDMRQGDTAVLDLRLTAPHDMADYLIRLDMVDEGITWFSAKNSRPAEVRLVVK